MNGFIQMTKQLTTQVNSPRFPKKVIPALGLLTAGVISLSFMFPFAATSQERDRMYRTLTVSGQGTENIQATLAQVQLGVEAQGKEPQKVQQEVAQRSSAVVNFLKSRGVEKLRTTGINLNPVYSYTNNRQTLTGYQGSNIVSFRVATDKAGVILDEAVKAGASRIDSVSFTATDAAIAAAQKEALRKATQEAQAQAQAVFSSLNFSQKEIVSIQVNNANVPPPIPVQAGFSTKLSPAAEAPPSPVMGGEQEVQASVTLQISY
jgi:uncharacterized protein